MLPLCSLPMVILVAQTKCRHHRPSTPWQARSLIGRIQRIGRMYVIGAFSPVILHSIAFQSCLTMFVLHSS
ncbi:hypothetical protein B0H19DRAFT_1185173 [Mycena capillaripes]|nr:hypothetical protein B0H19DRAFT_1185173 [Mycena capillaripes]